MRSAVKIKKLAQLRILGLGQLGGSLGSDRRRSARKARRTQEERREKTLSPSWPPRSGFSSSMGMAGSVQAQSQGWPGCRARQEHYFRTKNDLVVATLKYAMDKAIEHARSLAEKADHSANSIDRFLANSEHFFLSPRYRAFVEIMVAARAQPKLLRHWSPLVRDAHLALNKIWTDRLTVAGYKPAEVNRFIELTQHLLRGLMLAETWLPYEANRRDILRAWRSLAPAILRDKAR